MWLWMSYLNSYAPHISKTIKSEKSTSYNNYITQPKRAICVDKKQSRSYLAPISPVAIDIKPNWNLSIHLFIYAPCVLDLRTLEKH